MASKRKSVSSAAARARCRIIIVFLPIVPKEVEIDFQGLQLYGKSLYEISDKKEIILRRVKEFIARAQMGRTDSHRRAD